MRITVDIDDDTLSEVMKETGLKKKSTAISKAVSEYCQESRKKRFISRVMEGESDYSATNVELEKVNYDSN